MISLDEQIAELQEVVNQAISDNEFPRDQSHPRHPAINQGRGG